MLFASGVGWVLVLLICLGNLFCAYEVALYRAYSPQVVCGVAAVLPWISQAALLAIPRDRLIGAMGSRPAPPPPAVEDEAAASGETESSIAAAAGAEPTVLPPGEVYEEVQLPPEAQTPLLPDPVIYSRGLVTFNRRFFESKLARFTKIVPPDDAKDFVMLFKTSRGNHTTNYISKLDAAELHIKVAKGAGSENVKVPYLEIFEVQVRHKDLA
jgi:hypothetical protein